MAPQSLTPTRNLGRDSLRSLAPLLNDLPPPSFSSQHSSRRPARPDEGSSLQAKNPNMPLHLNLTCSQPSTSPPTPKSIYQPDLPRPLIKSSSLDSSSGQSESPPTPSGHQLHSISPSSYHAYRPEWISVSSPIIASSFDHPDYHVAPPSKRPRQLLNPEPRPPFRVDSQHDTDTRQHPAPAPSRMMPHGIKTRFPELNPAPGPESHGPLESRSGSCSPSSGEVDEPTYLQHSNDHALGSHSYSHLVAIPHPILMDEERSICSRALKNTSLVTAYIFISFSFNIFSFSQLANSPASLVTQTNRTRCSKSSCAKSFSREKRPLREGTGGTLGPTRRIPRTNWTIGGA
ncbi:hypothetical protein PTTG_09334 [Puccinia triticina 1-1 BBBD Race 1]|uniref:Uncharacterized protein n=1 Tax=Puccinia triticina (isolate 1-1 / race 1 (BBBD)) TaxID=630390 RepID=A0A0C4F847_PUCT1|nr:hypothetical protein PTTG_09334 [Puccinia triticina 1-1 BBBD Race 1]